MPADTQTNTPEARPVEKLVEETTKYYFEITRLRRSIAWAKAYSKSNSQDNSGQDLQNLAQRLEELEKKEQEAMAGIIAYQNNIALIFETAKQNINNYCSKFLLKDDLETHVSELNQHLDALSKQLADEITVNATYERETPAARFTKVVDETDPIKTAEKLADTVNFILDDKNGYTEKLHTINEFRNLARNSKYGPATRAAIAGTITGLTMFVFCAAIFSVAMLSIGIATGGAAVVPTLLLIALLVPAVMGTASFIAGASLELANDHSFLSNRGKGVATDLKTLIKARESWTLRGNGDVGNTPMPLQQQTAGQSSLVPTHS